MQHYYNEFDPKAAAWLRELIKQGHIPQGTVDERSITEITPTDLRGFTQCHFFAGIGGWPLALKLAGWPEDRPVWTGSCPCQPFSNAGKQLADKDERHLWPVFFNLIRECRPHVVFGEQVASSAVVGKRSAYEDVREMLDRKSIGEFLRQQVGEIQDAMQGLRESPHPYNSESELCRPQGYKEGIDTGFCGTIPGEQNGATIQPECGEHPGEDRQRHLRVDRDTVRPEDPEGMEQSIARSNRSEERLHPGQREGCVVLGECDEPQLGAESDSEDLGIDQESAEAEVERLVAEIGGETEEQAPVWLDGIQDDLEGASYAVGACVMAASSVGAPHIRQRLYWVANSNSGAGFGKIRGIEFKENREKAGVRENIARSGKPGGTSDDVCRMGDADSSGLGEQRGAVAIPPTQFAAQLRGNAWDSYDALPCRDGKTRRVESGTFPLAHGVPARVGRLRGYGNAIVPQVAAEFISAYLDLLPQSLRIASSQSNAVPDSRNTSY